MTTIQLMANCQKYYEPLRKATIQSDLEEEVNRFLSKLESVCLAIPKELPSSDVSNLTTHPDELKFWLVDVARLMLEGKSERTKLLALQVLEAAVPHLGKTNYQEMPVWGELRVTICQDYTSMLDSARSEKNPYWHRMWSVLVLIMGRDLCQGAAIINLFLSIVEAGFRSSELSIREQSFDCWRLLVEVFSVNKQVNLPKRIKLICIPLKSSKSKTEAIALKKFDIWWFLLNELHPELDGLAETIFEPFIYFCFGPSFKPPLCYYFDDSYHEVGYPGKIYRAIKQLSAIALIHLLGPATEVCKTLLISPDAEHGMLPFQFPKDDVVISSTLFSTKAKLLIDACTECTVLFAQMKHLNYLELNRCLWGNLMQRIDAERTVPKNELLLRIKENTTALLKLCIKQNNDVSLRELLYDTLLIIAKSDLLTVNIGHDCPEQPMLNYKSFMSVILNPELPCPGNKSEEIIKHVFGLQRYSRQKGYWEMLQKTIQYLSDTDRDSGNTAFRTIRTQIYCHLASFLIAQIRDDPAGFTEHQSTVMHFLLYPLEYDQLVDIDCIKSRWNEVYEPIAKQDQKTCDFTNAFCDMVKAMTIAKFAFNLDVVADFFCTILRSLSVHFDPSKPPLKVLELFKDLTRKAQAYEANLNRVEKMVCCFRELLSKMSITNVLTLILPIRNAINEMVSNETSLTMDEVKRTLNVVANKMVSTGMSGALVRQPKEVRWNCRMLLSLLLDLPAEIKSGWKLAEMKKCMTACDGKNAKTPTRKVDEDEFVVIDSNWKFKPEILTEHQREKMMEKRTDIPALYNDLSQSQDSFVIKPWTPNKTLQSAQREQLDQAVVSSSADTQPKEVKSELLEKIAEIDSKLSADSKTAGQQDKTTLGKQDETTLGQQEETPLGQQDETTVGQQNETTVGQQNETTLGQQNETTLGQQDGKVVGAIPDKENNDGNVVNDQSFKKNRKKEENLEDDSTEMQRKRVKKKSLVEQLRIDTVEGKTLDIMNLSRTRRSEVAESRNTRRKSIPTRKVESERKPHKQEKQEERSLSIAKDETKNNKKKVTRNSRKLLNFENIGNISMSQSQPSTVNNSEDAIESSQTTPPSKSLIGRKSLLRRSSAVESMEKADSAERETGLKETELNTNMAEGPESRQLHELKVTSIDSTEDRMPKEENASHEVLSVVGSNADVKSDNAPKQIPELGDQIVSKITRVEQAKVTEHVVSLCSSMDRHNNEEKTPVICKKEVNSETSTIRNTTHLVKESFCTPMSPNRRSTRLASTDENNAKLCYSPVKKPSDMNSVSKETHILTKSPRKPEKEDKGEPFKSMIDNFEDSVRAAVHLLQSPRKNLSDGTEHRHADSLTGVQRDSPASPNVARYSPLVVVEPIKSYTAVVIGKSDNVVHVGEPNEESSNVAIGSASSKESKCDQLSTVDSLSPVKNLDEEMEPLNKSMNCSIVSSPDVADADMRNADLMNNTVNISPISEEKGMSVKPADSGVLAGSADRRSINRNTLVHSATASRSAKPSPTAQAASAASCTKVRTQQNQMPTSSSSVMGTPRSPSTSMINLGGRGAKLINLIRNQYNDNSPKPNTPPQSASTPKGGQGSAFANRLMMRKKVIATSAAASGTPEANAPMAMQDKQYLVFEKVLPSPQASPASSILKRRHNNDDSAEDIELPVNKRKRVSFHDPPVSTLKEYIREVEECRSPSISKCLQLATSMSSADKAKYMMRRRSKSDSILELQKFTKNHDGMQSGQEANPSSADVEVGPEAEEEELTSSPESLDESQFMIHDATDNMAALHVTPEVMEITKSSGNPESSSLLEGRSHSSGEGQLPEAIASNDAQEGLRFTSEEAALEFVLRRYTLDDIVERYHAAGRTLEHGKSVRLLTKELSSAMSKNPRTRHLVLDELSERHSDEFLEHALQENSSSVVCERLSISTMIDHIFKQLHNDGDTWTKNKSPNAVQDEKDNDRVRLIESIYEKLLNLPNIESNGQMLTVLRDRFLQDELARKSRLEIMALLEKYFQRTGKA